MPKTTTSQNNLKSSMNNSNSTEIIFRIQKKGTNGKKSGQ